MTTITDIKWWAVKLPEFNRIDLISIHKTTGYCWIYRGSTCDLTHDEFSYIIASLIKEHGIV